MLHSYHLNLICESVGKWTCEKCCGVVSSKVSLAQDENLFLCISAIFLSWCGVSFVVRQSSVTARWSHVVWLRSFSTVRWVMVGWVAPLVPVADSAVDCGSVGSSILLGGHTRQVVYIMVFQVLWLFYGSHLVMVGWVASYVVIDDGAASTELSSLFLKNLFYLCVWHVCAFYVLHAHVFLLCTCPRVSKLYELSIIKAWAAH